MQRYSIDEPARTHDDKMTRLTEMLADSRITHSDRECIAHALSVIDHLSRMVAVVADVPGMAASKDGIVVDHIARMVDDSEPDNAIASYAVRVAGIASDE